MDTAGRHLTAVHRMSSIDCRCHPIHFIGLGSAHALDASRHTNGKRRDMLVCAWSGKRRDMLVRAWSGKRRLCSAHTHHMHTLAMYNSSQPMHSAPRHRSPFLQYPQYRALTLQRSTAVAISGAVLKPFDPPSSGTRNRSALNSQIHRRYNACFAWGSTSTPPVLFRCMQYQDSRVGAGTGADGMACDGC